MYEDLLHQRLEAALAVPDSYDALYDLALALKADGMSQADLYLLVEETFVDLPVNHPACQHLAELSDQIWAGPSAGGSGLFEHELTEEQLKQAWARRLGAPADRHAGSKGREPPAPFLEYPAD